MPPANAAVVPPVAAVVVAAVTAALPPMAAPFPLINVPIAENKGPAPCFLPS